MVWLSAGDEVAEKIAEKRSLTVKDFDVDNNFWKAQR